MITNNIHDKVILLFDKESSTSGYEYSIYKITKNGCRGSSPILSGIVVYDKIEVSLEDGLYQVLVYREGFPDVVENFAVYYNMLPNAVAAIQDTLCPCNNCKEITPEKLMETLMFLLGFLNSFGALCQPYYRHKILSKYYAVLMNNREKEKWYGTVCSVQNTKKAIKDVIAGIYAGLFFEVSSQLSVTEDIIETDNLLNSEYITHCFNNLGYDLQDMVCEVEKYKCDCNGL